ncbi:hypothetical protein HK407_05g10000 [Ordospora pajunii]|jgi:hypothetical protein|uniref:uncharacterized protein n=1 Tax=Ordospora pajunii TaxID=3039483 RepID=UPI002952607D|nr:uncharacterized protein HK407_05g10000 [Ordospora pajunii]KAH9411334.1 hypothetical protein HK407_05g10000 [Ordospora pajunii]
MGVIRLKLTDRMSMSIVVTIDTRKTIGELKEEICKRAGKSKEQILLVKCKRELVDAIDIDTYELRDGECIEVEYR